MAGKNDHWFKPRRYGWGWGLPQTWQGWVSFGIFIAVWLGATFMLLPAEENGPLSAGNIVTFVAIITVDVAGFVYVLFKHGEPPTWNWGSKSKKSTKPKADK